jgi:hypothetical protein
MFLPDVIDSKDLKFLLLMIMVKLIRNISYLKLKKNLNVFKDIFGLQIAEHLKLTLIIIKKE